MFRCRTVDGLKNGADLKMILDKDYSVECFVGAHAQYLWVAYTAILLYAMGVPMILFFLLWKMRHHLHEKNVTKDNHHHHLEVFSVVTSSLDVYKYMQDDYAYLALQLIYKNILFLCLMGYYP